MCLIAVLKKGAKLDFDEFERIWNQNPDGFGFAYFKGEQWNVVKGMMDLDGAYEIFSQSKDNIQWFHIGG